jgi:drug/metabolite transporter (DMT)-like permease
VGVVVFEGLGAEGESLLGDLAVLGAAGGVGAYSVASMPLLERHSPLTVATYPIVFSVPLLVVLSLPQGLSLEWGAWAAIGYSALFATAFAFAGW